MKNFEWVGSYLKKKMSQQGEENTVEIMKRMAV